MRLGALSTCIMHLGFDEGLAFLTSLGSEAIEIGCGGFEPPFHEDSETLLGSQTAFRKWHETFRRHEIEISAFAIHGEPLSPHEVIARQYDQEFRRACALAEMCGVTRLTLLAGIPEGAPGDKTPCWITGAFPAANAEISRWQWEERVIPYWEEHAKIAQDHGCVLCFEMIENDVVYNPVALMRLREAVGPAVRCNFDPSHLFCQGIDPLSAMRFLGDVIDHVHVKDTRINSERAQLVGLLDPTPHSQLADRAWSFRTVGYGHSEMFWRDFVSTLRVIGYDGVLSIEHEDGYMELGEGVEKAFEFLKPLVLRREIGEQWFGYEHTGAKAAGSPGLVDEG